MFLWISPILKLLEESGSLVELESIVTTLPRDLEEMSVNSAQSNSLVTLEVTLAEVNLSTGIESFSTESAVVVTLPDCQESQGCLSGSSLQRGRAIFKNMMFSLDQVSMKTA